ncbi:unnamed protein product [Mytilus coruscus]|uniref:Uncharacterized protein n=1 Tax=Mytilus coruscus TaxID=42192 RepID=A0A6J8D4Z7_MYTCO|nr:unnamed protein product [Mytilus coruscus]
MAKLEKNVHVTEYLNQNIKTLSDLREVHKNIKETVESLGQQLHEASSSLPSEIDYIHKVLTIHKLSSDIQTAMLTDVMSNGVESFQTMTHVSWLYILYFSSDIQTAMLTDVMSNDVKSFQIMTHVLLLYVLYFRSDIQTALLTDVMSNVVESF